MSFCGLCTTGACNECNRNIAKNTAIEALEKQMMDRWIPITERLPNEEECNIYTVMHPYYRQFICTIEIKSEVQTRQLFYSKVFGWEYGPEDYNKFVTAWKPLTEPYKEKL
jgi:hypothetical protein